MKTVLLAGGYAKRLWPLTKDQPKPLLPVAGKPIIEYIVDELEKIEELKEIYISTNLTFETNFKEWLINYRSSKELKLVIEETKAEQNKLGSIGALNFLINNLELNDDLLIIGGDNLFDFDITDLIDFYRAKNKSVVLLYDMVEKERVKGKYGVLELNSDFKIINLEEKPEAPKSTLISTACYIFTKDDLAMIKEYLASGNNPDAIGFFLSWLCKKSDLYGLIHSGIWFDIGSFDEYERANTVYAEISKSQERIIFDNRTQMNADNQDFKYKELTEEIIRIFYRVYNKLGYGFLEKVYENAMMMELKKAGFPAVSQYAIKVLYEGEVIGEYYADILVENKVIVEIKAARSLVKENEAQLLNYLKATDIEVGLLVNFGTKPEVKRKAFDNLRK